MSNDLCAAHYAWRTSLPRKAQVVRALSPHPAPHLLCQSRAVINRNDFCRFFLQVCQCVDGYLGCTVRSGDKNSGHMVLNDCQSSIKPIQGQMSLRANSGGNGSAWQERVGGGIVPSGLLFDSIDIICRNCHVFLDHSRLGTFFIFDPPILLLIKELFVGIEESPWWWHPPALENVGHFTSSVHKRG